MAIEGSEQLHENKITITNYTGTMYNVVLPSQIDGKAVISIGDSAFCDCSNLVNIIIPDSVTSIGNYAFNGCDKLRNVSLPKKIEHLGYGVFSSSYITDIAIPKTLKTIEIDPIRDTGNRGKSPFSECDNLKTVTFEAGTTKIIPCILFNSKVKTVVIPDGVTEIGSNAFNRCASLEEINLPDSLVCIGKAAFYNCSWLEKIVFPDSMTRIENEAFSGCNELRNVSLPKKIEYLGYKVFTSPYITELTIPKTFQDMEFSPVRYSYETIYYYTQDGPFSGCNNLKTVTFENGTKKIPACALFACTSVENIYCHAARSQR